MLAVFVFSTCRAKEESKEQRGKGKGQREAVRTSCAAWCFGAKEKGKAPLTPCPSPLARCSWLFALRPLRFAAMADRA